MGAAESSLLDAASDRESRTKDRLLDAAERLFAERGFAGTSLRAVTEAAGTSVSAANYHFGSKEALLRATLLRRVEPVNRARLAGLDLLEAAADRPPEVEAVLEAFLRPALEMRAASPEGAARIRQVAARLYADPPEVVAALAPDLFRPVHERFVAALARALPERPRPDIEIAYHFTVGVLVHLIGGHLEPPAGPARTPDPLADPEALLGRVVAYAAAGLRAATAPAGERRRGVAR